MLKKIAFIALLTAALICGIWGYFYLQELKKPTLKPIHVLPDNCLAVLEVKNPSDLLVKLTQGNLIWEEFLKINDVRIFNKTFLFLDSIIDLEDSKDILGNETFWIAFYGNETKQKTVFAFNIADVNKTEQALAMFESKFFAKKQTENIYQCVLTEGTERTTFYVSIEAGLVIASTSDSLVNVISSKNNKQTLAENKQFVKAENESAHDKELNVFLHFPDFYLSGQNKLFSPALRNKYLSERTERWLPIEMGIEPAQLSAKGFLPSDSTVLYNVINNQEAIDYKLFLSSLPYQTTCFEAVSISNYGDFVKDNYRASVEKRHNDLKKYADSLASDAQTEIAKFIGNYASVLETDFGDTVFQYGIINISDNEKALEFLKNTADSILANNDTANLFNYNDKLLFKNLTAGFYQQSFKYYSVVNECVLACNSIKGIFRYKESMSGRNNFAANERASSFLEQNFNSELNYLFYTDVFKTKEKLKSFLSVNVNKQLDEAPELYEKFDALAFSMQKIKENVLFTAQAGFNPKYKTYQNTLWETLLDTELYRLPTLVVNHKTNENELVCQDKNNTLYLLSNTGRILWKNNVKEKVLGDLRQVDYFANGKLQLLFVTENYIHVIDRNGNYIKDFPVKIKSGAAGGISLFDYDNTKNYRMWIPLKNNTVCCLSASCKPVEGFVPVVVKAPLARPVKQLVIQQKDYFVLTDTLGNIYIANRKGEERLKIETKLPEGNYDLYYDVGKDITKTFLCYVDLKTKTFRKLSLNNKVASNSLQTNDKLLGFFFDASVENTPSLVLIKENAFETIDFFGKRINKIETNSDLQSTGKILKIADKTAYASLDRSSGALVLAAAEKTDFNASDIKLSDLPGTFNLINGQANYLVGYYQNKIFCIKP